MDLVYSDVINLLVSEVGESLSKGVPFLKAFRQAPSFKFLFGETEILQARKEVASRLSKKRAEKEKLRRQGPFIANRQTKHACHFN